MVGAIRVAVVTVTALVVTGSGAGAWASPSRTISHAIPIRVTIHSPTHHPVANKPWPVRITVTNRHGKPVAAKLTMRVLFQGAPVGKIDKGAVYHFVGTWKERKRNEITWPPAARGEPLVFQAVVTAKGVTVKKNWKITVR